ncbi:hypothetical protein RB195_019617 [Necator americanus]|uniref:Insulin-like domain-containing protein n=1 Tax=Necator americanus TaxID=51031 RepID=A0ABR1CGP0_NECAM
MSYHCWQLLTFILILSSTVTYSSPQARYCGRRLTKALFDLCGAVTSPFSDRMGGGHRPYADLGIVHHCCHKPCDVSFMRRYCATK